MGSLTSRPKVPKAQTQIVYVPQASTSSSTPSTNMQNDPSVGNENTQTPEEREVEARSRNLLGRERGRFGTVLTGFRGLLNVSDPATSRKQLLGE